MSMVTKFRVVQGGRIVAYEYVKDGRWYHVWVAEGVEIAGATRITGNREMFTGRIASDGKTEIYENDSIVSKAHGPGIVFWYRGGACWDCWFAVDDPHRKYRAELGNLTDPRTELTDLTVIGRHEDTDA